MTDHIHVVCEQCWSERHPGEDIEDTIKLQDDAVRCCFCAHFSRLGLTENSDEECPRLLKDDAWREAAHLPEPIPDDPREIKTDQ